MKTRKIIATALCLALLWNEGAQAMPAGVQLASSWVRGGRSPISPMGGRFDQEALTPRTAFIPLIARSIAPASAFLAVFSLLSGFAPHLVAQQAPAPASPPDAQVQNHSDDIIKQAGGQAMNDPNDKAQQALARGVAMLLRDLRNWLQDNHQLNGLPLEIRNLRFEAATSAQTIALYNDGPLFSFHEPGTFESNPDAPRLLAVNGNSFILQSPDKILLVIKNRDGNFEWHYLSDNSSPQKVAALSLILGIIAVAMAAYVSLFHIPSPAQNGHMLLQSGGLSFWFIKNFRFRALLDPEKRSNYLRRLAGPLGGIPLAVTIVAALAGFVWYPIITSLVILAGQFSGWSDRQALQPEHRRDPLSGLWTRGILEWKDAAGNFITHGYLPRQVRAALHSAHPRALSGLWIDLDGFGTAVRSIGGKAGKQAGDAYIAAFGQMLRNQVRGEDISLIRWGGDEFFVLLPGTDITGAQVVAQHILDKIRTLEAGGIRITASIGVAQVSSIDRYQTLENTVDAWWARGDLASKEAKEQGKDRIVLSQAPALHTFISRMALHLHRVHERIVAFQRRLARHPQEPFWRYFRHSSGWGLLFLSLLLSIFHSPTWAQIAASVAGERLVHYAQLGRLRNDPYIDAVSKAWNWNYLELARTDGFLPHLFKSALWHDNRRTTARPNLTVLLLDLEYFKQVNDQWGHEAGDQALQDVVKAISTTALRPGDSIVREKGKRFLIVLQHTNQDGGLKVAGRVRDAIRKLPIHIQLETGARQSLTATILVSQAEDPAGSLDPNYSAAAWLEKLGHTLDYIRDTLQRRDEILTDRDFPDNQNPQAPSGPASREGTPSDVKTPRLSPQETSLLRAA